MTRPPNVMKYKRELSYKHTFLSMKNITFFQAKLFNVASSLFNLETKKYNLKKQNIMLL